MALDPQLTSEPSYDDHAPTKHSTRSTSKDQVLVITPVEYRPFVDAYWPATSAHAKTCAPLHAGIYDKVRKYGVPNYMGAKAPIPSGLNIPAWRESLSAYDDNKICDYLEFGWPINYSANFLPHPTPDNHLSAMQYSAHVQEFLDFECGLGAMLGPFTHPPYTPWFQTSPIMTRPKKDTLKRRVIIDLSFPEGRGVNAGIPKHSYEGLDLSYSLPTISDLAALVALAGRGAWLWKVDLERAYRQLRIDPLAYPLLGIRHNDKYYVDICPSFGCRVSGAAQQRVSEALCALLHTKGYKVLAYVDDFGGVQASYSAAQCAFDTFNDTCAKLGLKVAADKSAAPAQKMEWLGYEIDTLELTVTIPEKKLVEVLDEVKCWEGKAVAGKRELQSLAGKLAHISSCVRHARKFIGRILAQLRSTPKNQRRKIGRELKKDLLWFKTCALALNRKQIIQLDWPTFIIECDACLTGGGGFSQSHYFATPFPGKWRERYHISQIEAINTLVAFKTLVPPYLTKSVITIKTDNSASASVLVTGRSHDPVLAACSRELAMLVITQQLEIDVTHVPGASLTLADALSRRHTDADMVARSDSIISSRGLLRAQVPNLDTILTPDL